MFYLPLFHRLAGSSCLVVGGGQTALRKLRWLVRAEAKIKVIAPEVDPEIQKLRDAGKLTIEKCLFYPQAVSANLVLVISATDAPNVSEEVFVAAMEQGVLVNCVDRTELCTVIFPAIIDRFPILVAVSSMGRSPTLSRSVRGWIELRLPNALGQLAELAGRLRSEVKSSLPSVDARKAFWEEVFSSKAADEAMYGSMDAAVAEAEKMMASASSDGSIVLVGAGPGDPELITLKGLRAIQSADVLMYDKLANPALLEYARRDVELIDVGKKGPREAVKEGSSDAARPSGTTMQQEINQTLIEQALKGKKVVRLKGGDPFIFGRGGEELLAAAEQGIAVEIVPGITAAMGGASYAGIPLTHRHMSQSVRFVTGHSVEHGVNIDWPELAKPEQTLVIYMGLVGIEKILQRLVDAGRGSETPAVLLENATLPSHREVFGRLDNLASKVREAEIEGPSIIIVGEVAGIPEQVQNLYTAAQSTTDNL
ncbi:MAG: uroporphyrin-III C-methyltransferase/precorrin-2 dehydrogenase/sirohydrochlorin ferrochelatase [Candidatus Azotimanducaceae bacterium]